ncbi:Ig-like domain-containing protein [Arthrospira platensis]|uniref:Ig-like domain-containing protein n=6 Tax=Limnospira TaxID=2596745 RepID=UPI0007A10140|nr:adhesin [Arthrospira platensis YZ]
MINPMATDINSRSFPVEWPLSAFRVSESLNTGQQVVIIDSGVEDYRELIRGLRAVVDVIILDPNRDGVLQIAETLHQYNTIAQIHIICHGSPGCLKLGNVELTSETLPHYSQHLETLNHKLHHSSIILYSCLSRRRTQCGETFLKQLHQLTGANISASTTPTGNHQLGGDWDFQASIGNPIDTDSIFSQVTMATYSHTLAFESDDFNTNSLNAWWNFITPNNNSSYLLTGTGTSDAYVELSVPGATDMWNRNRSASRLMQAAQNQDFELEIKFAADPALNKQMQGILVEQDDNNWLRFDVFKINSDLALFAGSTRNGGSRSMIRMGVQPGQARHLKVNRTGDVWTLNYSPDGSTWTTAGSFTEALQVQQVGLFAGNADSSSSPQFTSQVDYFFNTAAPIIPEDGQVVTPEPVENQPPIANDDTVRVEPSQSVIIDVLSNDSDPDGVLVPDTVTVVDLPDYGTITVNPNGTITYSHDGSSTSTDSFTYTVEDDDGATSNEATVFLTIEENQPPTANDDNATVRTGNAVTINVLNNDSDLDGVLIPDTVTVVDSPNYGNITVNPNGTITYSHDGSSTSTDSFTYTVEDDDGATSNEATVFLTIEENQPPTANDDNATVRTGNAVTINVLNNDSDLDGVLIPDTVTVVDSPNYGTITVNPNGTITYSHDGSSTSTDRFTYTVEDDDGATSNEATVFLTIEENQPPTANDDNATVRTGNTVTINVLSNDSDPDGVLVPDTVTVVDSPNYGNITVNPNGTITYSHDGSSSGTDSFTYTVEDNDGATSNLANVSITIQEPSADPNPTVLDIWYGSEQSFGHIGKPLVWVNILGYAFDPDGISSLSYSLNGGPEIPLRLNVHGESRNPRLSRNGDFNVEIAYTDLNPASDHDDIVVITAVDTLGHIATESVTIKHELGNAWPKTYSIDWSEVDQINDVAQVVDGLWTLTDDGVRTAETGYDRLIAIGDIGWDDYEATVPITIHETNTNGIIGLLMRWKGHQPDGGTQPYVQWRTHGEIGFYHMSSGLSLEGSTFFNSGRNITLEAGNTYNFKMRSQTVDDGSIYSFKVWEESEPEPTEWDRQSFKSSSDFRALSHGSLLLVAHYYDATFGDVTVVPYGEERPNLAPIANNDHSRVSQGNSVNIRVLSNDEDIDGSLMPNTVTIVTEPNHGTVSIQNGVVTYNHNGSYISGDRFTYTVEDNHGATSNEATVFLGISELDLAFNSDDFNSSNLKPEWNFIKPLANSSYALTGTGTSDAYLELSVPANTDLWNQNRTIARLMQPAANEDFELQIKFASDPTVAKQMQGILVEQDERNWLRFNVSQTGSGLSVFGASTTNGSSRVMVSGSVATGEARYLNVNRQGNLWTLKSSGDGINWNTVGSFIRDLQVQEVGLFAGHAGKSPAMFTSQVDYFFNMAAPIVPEDVSLGNQPPIANDDTVRVEPSQSVIIDVLSNDSDPDGVLIPDTVTVVDSPDYGTITVNPNGTITYSHDGSSTSTDSFTYTVEDDDGAISNLATVSLTIQENQPPTANDDNATVRTGNTVTINVLNNDSDLDGVLIPDTVTVVDLPDYGNITVNPNGTITYSHDGSSTSTDSFTYTVEDDDGAISNLATVSLTIQENQPPTANDDNATVRTGNAVTINVLNNDSDLDGVLIPDTVTVVDLPDYGNITVNPNGTITYSHDGSSTNSDRFTYTVEDDDGAISNLATVSLTIQENQPPTANDDNAIVMMGNAVTINVLSNDSDPDGVLIPDTVTVVDSPNYGHITVNPNGTITYSHDGSSTSTDSFTYTVEDNDGAISNPATVSLTVSELDLAFESDDFNTNSLDPRWNFISPNNNSSYLLTGTGTSDAYVELSVPGATDMWNRNRSASRLMQPAQNQDFELEIKFAADPALDKQIQGILVEQDDSNWVRFDVFKTNSGLALFAASTRNGGSRSMIRMGVQPGQARHLKVNREGDVWTLNYSPDGVSWTTAGSFTEALQVQQVGLFAGNAGSSSSPPFTSQVDYFFNTAAPIIPEDGQVVIPPDEDESPVIPEDEQLENQPPTANDDNATVRTGNAVTINVLDNDSDPDGVLIPDTVTIVDSPDYGNITVNPNGTITYSHDGSSTNSDRFTYTVEDDDGAISNLATVSLTIQENQPPTANDDNAIVMMGNAVTINVLSNDSDPDGVLIPDTVTVVDSPNYGNITVNPNGTITYSHDGSSTSTDSFTYTVEDNDGAISNPATVSLTVSELDLAFQSDDFNTNSLDPRWNFISPSNNSSYLLTGTGTPDAYVELSVPGATDMWNRNRSASRLMQPAQNQDFELEIKFAADPALDKQIQGILVEQDDSNWVRFDVFKTNSGLALFAASTRNGGSRSMIRMGVQPGQARHLKVNREGDVWTLNYSPDGVSWTTAGSFTEALQVQQVGLFAGNAGSSSSPPFTSQVDYFFNTAAPIIPEDTPDLLPPTAALLAPDLTPILGSDTGYAFTVSYSDDWEIQESTLDDADIRVIGPLGVQQLASLVRVYGEDNGNTRNATYQIAPSGGVWDVSDGGTYTVIMEPNAVSDVVGNFVPTATLGSFTIDFGTNTTQNIVFPADAGVVDVRDYGAIPNDGIDDTAAIQQAINENAGQNRIIYFPNGVYDVSGQITYPGSQKRNILQGESRDRTIIRLQDNLGFDTAVIDTGNPPAQRFRNSIRDLTVDVGEGNPDAIAISFIANNQGTINNVRIVSRDGQGAIGLDLATDENGPLLVKDVEVVGFDVGIRTWNPTATQTLEGVKLVNQNVYGWQNFNQTLFVRDLESTNAVPVIWNMPDGSSDFTIMDANLTGVGAAATQPAIYNQKGMYVNNLNTSGYQLAIRQDDNGRGNLSQPDGYVAEWMAHGGFNTLFDAPNQAFELEVLPTPVVPWDDLSDWVSPLAFGGLPNDGIDDTLAIQAAIDSGASTVYLPNGVWNIGGNLQLRNNLQRFIGTEATILGSGTITVADGSADVVSVERLEAPNITFIQDSDRTMVMSNMIINQYFNTSQGTGDLYIEDISGGPWSFTNQNVWARQINPENIHTPRIKNDGGNLWILGYKTEDEGTLVETVNGGKTEVLGAYILHGEFGDIPVFINNESSLSYVAASFRTFKGEPLPAVGVEEIQNLETRRTVGLPGYYSSTSLNRVPINTIVGTQGDDWLNGTDPNSATPGRGQIDILTGNGGFDTFVLGDSNSVYYDDGIDDQPGWQDYALITDFNNDVIQLHGSSEDYRLADSPQGLPTGLAIFYKGDVTDELIGIVQGVNNISLNSSSFVYV